MYRRHKVKQKVNPYSITTTNTVRAATGATAATVKPRQHIAAPMTTMKRLTAYIVLIV